VGADWRKKVEAFLACLPEEFRNQALQKVSGSSGISGEAERAEAERAKEWAKGLDIPPHISEPSQGLSLLRTHPISEKRTTLQLDNIRSKLNNISKVFQRIPEGSDPKPTFLTLWRCLPLYLEEAVDPRLPLWPADLRIPSHSFWVHASVASAIAGAMPDPAFLIFTVGSVQDFIGQARRTHDLWGASYLLSYLMWEAIKSIVEDWGPDTIVHPCLFGNPLADRWLRTQGIDVPAPDTDALLIAAFPNKFAAILPHRPAADVAKKANEGMKGAWREIACAVKGYVEDRIRAAGLPIDDGWHKVWEDQIEHFLDFQGVYWSVYPWKEKDQARQDFDCYLPSGSVPDWVLRMVQNQTDPRGMLYTWNYQMASHTLDGRKRLRDFPGVEEPGWKCALCGVRRAVVPEQSDERDFWRQLRGHMKGRVRRGEMLCAVCLTKRLCLEAYFTKQFGVDYHVFPSTATVATVPFKRDVLKKCQEGANDLRQALERYVQAKETMVRARLDVFYYSSSVPALRKMAQDETEREFIAIDGEWLYETVLDPDYIAREFNLSLNDSQKEAVQEAKSALQGLLRAARKAGIRRPSRYLALVKMDGDRMGQWVSGQLGPAYEVLVHPSLQSTLRGQPWLEQRRPLGPATHVSLSLAMQNFAVEVVRWAVEEIGWGRVIYAGGDDLLAVLPLENLAKTLRYLRYFFQGKRNSQPISDDPVPFEVKGDPGGWLKVTRDGKSRYLLLSGPNGVTISAGIVIFHETHPLSHAVDEASKALEEAKEEEEGAPARWNSKEKKRDAFKFYLFTRQGRRGQVRAKWFIPAPDGSGETDVMELVQRIHEIYHQGKPSARLVYEIEELTPAMTGRDWNLTCPVLKQAVARHIQEDSHRRPFEPLGELLKAGVDWETVANLVLIAHFMAREG